MARLWHRQSMGTLTGRAAFPSHGLRFRNRLAPALCARLTRLLLPMQSSSPLSGEGRYRFRLGGALALARVGQIASRLGRHAVD
jgi:hypothetical protein